MKKIRIGALIALTSLVGVLGLAACSSAQPASTETIVVGSQAYYSNEIIAEIYAQALEHNGVTVDRQFQLGQRDVYMPALESGEIDLFPEYTGNLLQYLAPDATATETDPVYQDLLKALPQNLSALAMSPATDQDSYNVTTEFAKANGNLKSLEDLAKVKGLILGGAPELAERPYGPSGLKDKYGVDVTFQVTGDTTVDSLLAGIVNIANVYSADPRIAEQGLVTLADPKGLFLASNVVPIANTAIADKIRGIIDPISQAMTPADLLALNLRSVKEKLSAEVIARDWLTQKGFLG